MFLVMLQKKKKDDDEEIERPTFYKEPKKMDLYGNLFYQYDLNERMSPSYLSSQTSH